MKNLSIAADGRTFLRAGEPFLYAADTAWSAPTNASLDEWRSYLDLRASQGFTAVQVNLLPQWDRSRPAGDESSGPAGAPFEPAAGGRWDYRRPREAYFKRLDAFVSAIAEADLVPALVLLWADYVPGNWCSRMNPGREVPEEDQEALASYLAARYRPFAPVYLASGDTDLDGPETVSCYLRVLRASKKAAPEALTCLHVRGDYSAIPAEIQASPHLDFYMYQSGHQAVQDHLCRLAAEYRALRARPIVNGELCYEGMGRYEARERFEGRDVRRAVWLSLLTGANAGFGYGAYGVWNWHRPGDASKWLDLFGPSPTLMEALRLPEADAVGLAGELWRRYGLDGLVPLAPETPETREVAWAAVPDRGSWIGYSDRPRLLRLPAEAEPPRRATVWDFASGRVRHLSVFQRNGAAWLDLALCGGDALLVLERGR